MSRWRTAAKVAFVLALLPALAWSGLAILFVGGGAEGVGVLRWLLLALAVAAVGSGALLAPRQRPLPAVAVVLVVLIGFFCVGARADRDWTEDHSRASRIERAGDVVTIHDVRDFRYRADGDWDARWYDADYDLTELRAAWFAVEYFASSEAIAHTFVSFQFGEDRFLTVSVEIRKEEGEGYSPLRGLFRQFELIYVFGDERDQLDLRARHRGHELYLHPIDAGQPALIAFFEEVLDRADELYERPGFYNTVTASCTSTLASHLDKVAGEATRRDWRVYLPGYSGQLAWEMGLIAGELSWEETRARDLVTERAKEAGGIDDLSSRIRSPR
jgi:hypothetical protein